MKNKWNPATLGSLILLSYSMQVEADAQHRHGHDSFAEPVTSGVQAKSSTTVYGKVYSALVVHDDGEKTAGQLASSGSRLGVRGKLPMDNGMKLVWQIESSIDLDNLGSSHGAGNESTLAGRDSFIGLIGSMGMVLMGKHNTPYKNSVHSWDPFNHIAGDLRSILGHVPNVTNEIDHHGNVVHLRAPNSIIYHSPPSTNGLNASIGLHMVDVDEFEDETTGAVTDSRAISMSLEYNSGDLTAIYSLQYQKDTDALGDHDASPPTSSPIDEVQAHMFGIKYRLNETTLNFIYETISTIDSTATNENTRGAFHIGAIHRLGKHAIHASIAQAGEYNEADGATMLAVGYFHTLSKMSKVYVSYVTVDNDEEGNYGNFLSEHVEHGTDPSVYSLGLIHNF